MVRAIKSLELSSLPETYTDSREMHASQDQFINAWAEVGKCLGFSQTVAEIHALLYICARPLCTDDVMARLSLSRGNVSMCLGTLKDWGVIRRAHIAGVRKEYFETPADIREVVRTVVANRVSRHIHPALARIRQCNAALHDSTNEPTDQPSQFSLARSRLNQIESLIVAIDSISRDWIEYGLTPKKPSRGVGRRGSAIRRKHS